MITEYVKSSSSCSFTFYTFRWVKKCFEYHPSSEAHQKADWEKCIQAIDGKEPKYKANSHINNKYENSTTRTNYGIIKLPCSHLLNLCM